MSIFNGKLKLANGKTKRCEVAYDEKRRGWHLLVNPHKVFGKTKVDQTIDLSKVTALKTHGQQKFELHRGNQHWTFESAEDLSTWVNAITSVARQITVSGGRKRPDLPILEGAKESQVHLLSGKHKGMRTKQDKNDDLDYVSAIGEGKSWYLISRTKGGGGFGKFRFGMPMDGDQMVGIKEFRVPPPAFEDVEAKQTAWTSHDSLVKEIEVMRQCDSKLSFFRLLEVRAKVGVKYYGVMPLMLADLLDLLKADLPFYDLDGLTLMGRLLLRDIATDLESVHAAGYVFNDLKPANIFIGPEGPVLADYGVCEETNRDGICTVCTGSPGYVPPEMLPQIRYTKTRDIFTLGQIWAQMFYELAAGRPAHSTLWPKLYGPKDNELRRRFGEIDDQWLTSKPSIAHAWSMLEFKKLWEDIGHDTDQLDTPQPNPRTSREDYLRFTFGRLKAKDPEMFDFVWKNMLCPDPGRRCDATRVKTEANRLLSGQRAQQALTAFHEVTDRYVGVGDKHRRIREQLLAAKQSCRIHAPWDAPNIRQNLRVLGSLKEGDRLGVLETPTAGTFVLPALGGMGREGRVLREVFVVEHASQIKVARKGRGEDLLDDRQYMVPILQLFRSAVQLYKARDEVAVRKREIEQALQGLKRMAKSLRKTAGKKRQQRLVSIISTVELLIASADGITRQGGGIEIAGTTEVNLLRHPVMRRLKESFAGFFKSTCLGASLAEEASGAPHELSAIYGNTHHGTEMFTLPAGAHYKRSGLGICKQARELWKDVSLELDTTTLDLTDGQLAASIRALHQALGHSDGLLFCVSQLTIGLSRVVSLIFSYKYPKNFDTHLGQKIKPVFHAGGGPFAPVDFDCRLAVKTANGIRIGVEAVAAGHVVRFDESLSPRLAFDHLRDLRLARLAMQLEVSLTLDGSKVVLELQTATVNATALPAQTPQRDQQEQAREEIANLDDEQHRKHEGRRKKSLKVF